MSFYDYSPSFLRSLAAAAADEREARRLLSRAAALEAAAR